MVVEIIDFTQVEEIVEVVEIPQAGSVKEDDLTEVKAPGTRSDVDKNATMIQKEDVIKRPESVEAKVYRLKSRFVKERMYITLSYIKTENGINRPIEMFINSKDLSKLPEYTVLTRLISTIFRTFSDPKFILEELKSIYDPNGGYFLKGRYIYSFYSEIAMIIEKFFIDIGFMGDTNNKLDNWIDNAKKMNPEKEIKENHFKICPQCNEKSLQLDGGCLMCINPECGYSKCS